MCFQMFWRKVVHRTYYLRSLSNLVMQFLKANVNNLSAGSARCFQTMRIFSQMWKLSAPGNIDFSRAATRWYTILLNQHILSFQIQIQIRFFAKRAHFKFFKIHTYLCFQIQIKLHFFAETEHCEMKTISL